MVSVLNTPLNFAHLIPRPMPRHIFKLPEHMIWCNGAVRGEDGLYHMFFSRWLAKRGHHAWVTDSEVAHAVARDVLGPYEFSDVALPARGFPYWDGDVTHNPHILKEGGLYYLYYTGNHGSGYWQSADPNHLPSMDDPQWWENRNNQRVGVAVSSSPYGPWQRFNTPLADVMRRQRLTAQPAVMCRPDGKYMLVYKTVIEGPGHYGNGVQHFIALADDPLGPFIDQSVRFIQAPRTGFPIDDQVEWYQDGRFWCITKDHGEGFTEHVPALVLFESQDGLDWQLAANPLVMPFEITWQDGEIQKFDRLEMPKVYVEDGRARVLFLAAKPVGEEHSFSVAVPLSYEENTGEIVS